MILASVLGIFAVFGAIRPAPDLAELRSEPALVAPATAEERRRNERESFYGLFGNYEAYVKAVYVVDGGENDAYRAWLDAYGDQYQFYESASGGYAARVMGASVRIEVLSPQKLTHPEYRSFNFLQRGKVVLVVTVRGSGHYEDLAAIISSDAISAK
ncbi:hypothetical protein SAMN06309944_1159 [Micrococcales bacterium KH10]|nr:hypothetical protein SAMN06309944_1159 [Micrococcales bacterium KH10]